MKFRLLSHASLLARPVPAAPAWRQPASPLSRWAMLAMVLLIIDASLYPFTGWRDVGISPFAFLQIPWPRHALEFDMVVNVIGYLPLGLLGVFALYPRVRGFVALVLSTLWCSVLSLAMEAIQTYLPMRVASNVDLVTNVAGGLIGAALALWLVEPVLQRGRLRELRLRWFEADASRGLVVMALWFGAIVYPEPFALGCGTVLKALGLNPGTWLANGYGLDFTTDQFTIAEGLACFAALAAAGLLGLNLTRRHAPRAGLIAGFLVLTAFVKTLGVGMTYSSDNPFVWLSRGAAWGGLAAGLLLVASVRASATLRAWLALAALAVLLILVNGIPDSPYFQAQSHQWAHGRFLNFYGLTLGLSLTWPLIAAAYLIRGRLRVRRARFRTPV